jgi:enolase-phosphatase E1
VPLPPGTQAVLTDIEGTTTSISFVYDVLFPYAAARLDAWLEEHRPQSAIALLRREYKEEARSGAELPEFGNGAPYARHLMGLDRKSTGLKALQGLIWEEGYRSGELRSHVFPDVPPILGAWSVAGLRLRVFSSGSVQAQKLLFAHTEYGDLSELFEGFHDTTTGPKREAASYAAIAAAYGLPPEAILFLSDVTEELDAAAAAGMRTVLVVRPGNRSTNPGAHQICKSFAELV